jgi:hypothetical protein
VFFWQVHGQNKAMPKLSVPGMGTDTKGGTDMEKPKNGLAITGGVLSIVCGALFIIGALIVLVGAGGAMARFFPGGLAVILLITLGFGIPLIILGIGALKGKAGQSLAGAILLSVLSLFSLIGFHIIGILLYGSGCAFMWLGWRQNIQVAAWKASQG